jgi:glucose/mannose transport system substrate-binding protein
LGIHRINTLFYNRKIFQRYQLAAPDSWENFMRAARRLQQAGVVPLAQSSEPWQVATLFENLVLAEAGSGFYEEVFVKKSYASYQDLRFARALKRLRELKQFMPPSLEDKTWVEMTRLLADGGAGMLVMGDWAKGEMNAWGLATDGGFGCVAVPGTENYHLYDIDTLVLLAGDGTHRAAQEKLAQASVAPGFQAEYNQIKGSAPVLRNPDLARMDSCARASWKSFARPDAQRVPSLSHRMATDEISKDAIIAEVVRFFLDEQVSVAETQRRLGAMARTLQRKL